MPICLKISPSWVHVRPGVPSSPNTVPPGSPSADCLSLALRTFHSALLSLA
jgi:hypothetical protein